MKIRPSTRARVSKMWARKRAPVPSHAGTRWIRQNTETIQGSQKIHTRGWSKAVPNAATATHTKTNRMNCSRRVLSGSGMGILGSQQAFHIGGRKDAHLAEVLTRVLPRLLGRALMYDDRPHGGADSLHAFQEIFAGGVPVLKYGDHRRDLREFFEEVRSNGRKWRIVARAKAGQHNKNVFKVGE